MSKREPVIAIDGPAGAGKGAVSTALAERCGFALIETGAIYRSLAFVAGREGIALDDESALAARAAVLDISFEFADGVNRVRVAGEDITAEIRDPSVSAGASKVAKIGPVRAALLDVQRELARRGGAIAEGRDIGTVVLPDADIKFFLTATPEERARRRVLQLEQAGTTCSYEEILAAQKARDEADMTRAVAPLVQADDAVLVDSTDLDLEGVIGFMREHIEQVRAALTAER